MEEFNQDGGNNKINVSTTVKKSPDNLKQLGMYLLQCRVDNSLPHYVIMGFVL